MSKKNWPVTTDKLLKKAEKLSIMLDKTFELRCIRVYSERSWEAEFINYGAWSSNTPHKALKKAIKDVMKEELITSTDLRRSLKK